MSSLILDCSFLGNSCVVRQKHTDLDMKKGAWQSRGRTCKQVASPEGKEERVRKPYKKPRQVLVTETQEVESEGPTQLVFCRKDTSARVDVSEFYVERGTTCTLDKPKEISCANKPLQTSPASLKTVSESSDDEDNIPIHETIIKKGNVIPVTIPTMSERECLEVAELGEVQRWSSGEEDDIPITDLLKALKDKVDKL